MENKERKKLPAVYFIKARLSKEGGNPLLISPKGREENKEKRGEIKNPIIADGVHY
jgi:hypothetical protein